MAVAVGKKAPDFTLPVTGANSKTLTLSALKGQPVVVYFYPKDDTPGCTAQACGFRDTLGELQKMGAAVIGISKDSLAAHEKFAKKFELNFPLASDTDGAVCEAYGTWIEKSMYGKKYMGIDRATFLVDVDGKIAHIWRKVSVPGHIAEVAQAIHNLSQMPAAKRQPNDGNGSSSPAPRPKTRTAAMAQQITDKAAGINKPVAAKPLTKPVAKPRKARKQNEFA